MLWSIFSYEGQRKYLTTTEIDSFVRSARKEDLSVCTFCCMLAFSGCRISEALSLTKESIDFKAQNVIILSLKKRGKRIFRSVPLPPDYLAMLRLWLKDRPDKSEQLWPWSRMTAYRRVCDIMYNANISGQYASPKGLRHGFGVRAIQSGVPLTLVQRWLGHADIKTTAIYTSAIGPEERQIASRMWDGLSPSSPAILPEAPGTPPAGTSPYL